MLRNERKVELKERIYLQSLQLFKEKGFDQVTIEEITQVCGIAKGTFFNYFARKEAVLFHIGSKQIESVHESMRQYVHMTDQKEKLILIFHHLFDQYAAYPDMIGLTISEMMRSMLLMREELNLVKKFQDVLMSILEEAKKSGQLSEHMDCADVASVLIGIYFHSIMIWVSTGEGIQRLETIFRPKFEVVWEGIHPRRDAS
ncbi:TetR family transcriptional regulator [Paenibacillus ferrarius]|uniref:TetR family transcriptional regulator n=1 Tax=Paenibacillus ferrarius TaxID=1469647 RepID=A0A1V4HDT3_9BACL|nr:TetR/AcrR family transcriptional regulator [Paenibacillus ferrarius]OPH51169.1 TetR family transcriptional regulator [Paenibacillus ferrarius]